ncbi:hypothetical protein ZWY2020_025710 [Hordeum vulgare]|nr:hypothetical protein ZWY2020_025710 [Hordeum vulgare]
MEAPLLSTLELLPCTHGALTEPPKSRHGVNTLDLRVRVALGYLFVGNEYLVPGSVQIWSGPVDSCRHAAPRSPESSLADHILASTAMLA